MARTPLPLASYAAPAASTQSALGFKPEGLPGRVYHMAITLPILLFFNFCALPRP